MHARTRNLCATEGASSKHARESRTPGQRETGVHSRTGRGCSGLKNPVRHWHRSRGRPADPTPYGTVVAFPGHETFWAAAPGKHPRSPPPRKCEASQARSPATVRATTASQVSIRRRGGASVLFQLGSRRENDRPGPACARLNRHVSRVFDSLHSSALDASRDSRADCVPGSQAGP